MIIHPILDRNNVQRFTDRQCVALAQSAFANWLGNILVLKYPSKKQALRKIDLAALKALSKDPPPSAELRSYLASDQRLHVVEAEVFCKSDLEYRVVANKIWRGGWAGEVLKAHTQFSSEVLDVLIDRFGLNVRTAFVK